MTASDDATLVYLCDMEWCDIGYHVEAPEEFDAFYFTGDVEEFSGNDGHLIPLSEGELMKGYRMACGTWFISKPERLMLETAKKELEG